MPVWGGAPKKYTRKVQVLINRAATWRVVKQGVPEYISSKMTLENENYIETTRARLQTTARSYMHRSATTWNGMPDDLRAARTLMSFKKLLRMWIIGCREMETPG